VVVSELSSSATDNAATESRAGLRLLLSSDRGPDAGVNALFASSRATRAAPWSTPVRLAEFGASRSTSSPFESDDGTLVYFNQTDTGRDHLYRATRSDERCAYSALTAIAELNSPATDADPWFSADLRRVVFSSTRDGDPEIYESAR
jgi:Tol biopolymer transport system component